MRSKYWVHTENAKFVYYEGFYADSELKAKEIAREIAKEKGTRVIEVKRKKKQDDEKTD